MSHLFIAAMLFVLGYLVKYKRWSWLIAGYNTSSKDEKAKYDKEALCHGVGNIVLLLGGVVILAAVGEFLNFAWIVSFSWILFTVIIIVFLIYANTGNRYKK